MALTGQHCSTWREACAGATLSAARSKWTGGLWPSGHFGRDRPAADFLAMAPPQISCNEYLAVNFPPHSKHMLPSATVSRLILYRAICYL